VDAGGANPKGGNTREESPGTAEQGCRLTAGQGDL